MSEPSCERVSPPTGEEILPQSVSPLTPPCNRHKHTCPAQPTLILHFRCLSLQTELELVRERRKRGRREREGGGRGGEEKEGYVPGALGMPLAVENVHFSISSSSPGERGFQEARK